VLLLCCSAQEIVPPDRPSDDYHKPELIYPVVDVKLEELRDMKQEPADEDDNGDSHYVKLEPPDEYETESSCFPVQVSFVCTYSTDFSNKSSSLVCSCVF